MNDGDRRGCVSCLNELIMEGDVFEWNESIDLPASGQGDIMLLIE